MTLKYTNIAGESSAIPLRSDKNFAWGTYDGSALPEPATAPKPTKKGRSKGGQALAAAPIYTLETKPESKEALSPLQRLKENRLICKETANTLFNMGDFDTESPLVQAAFKIQNCSLAGAFRSLSNGVNYKIGQALCRCRLCPNCQMVLAVKRRHSFTEWFALNDAPLAGYRFYHMVLNVRHSVANKLRDGLYTSEMLESFAALRGSGKANNAAAKRWWNERVSGGVFSVELAPGKSDNSAHIHLHIILFCAPGTIPIYRKDKNSEFVKKASAYWRTITKDPKAKSVFLEPIYYKNEAGEKETYKPGQPIEQLYKAVAECMKYTLKSDESSLTGYTPEFLQELLTTPNRYFGRFGVLSKKNPGSAAFKELERLNTNFKDLEALKAKELETLYNPETGVVHAIEETRIALSYFRNTTSKEAPLASNHSVRGEKNRGGEKYYKFKDLRKVGFLHPEAQNQAALYLARTVKSDYDPDNDLATDQKE